MFLLNAVALTLGYLTMISMVVLAVILSVDEWSKRRRKAQKMKKARQSWEQVWDRGISVDTAPLFVPDDLSTLHVDSSRDDVGLDILRDGKAPREWWA